MSKDGAQKTADGRAGGYKAAFSDAILPAVILCGVMLAGSWQIIQASRQIDWNDIPHTWADFRQGRMTSVMEGQLERKLPQRAELIAIANAARYVLVRGAGEQVRLGREDWLFLTDELRFYGDADSNLAARAALLHSAAVALERRGVKLVVVLVPDKARIHQRKLGGALPEYNRARYRQALLAMRIRGISVVDLLGPLTLAAEQGEVYYRSDTHWNQAGARVAATAIAAEIRRLGLVVERAEFATETVGAELERPGDLIRLMGLENMPNILRPSPDREIPLSTKRIAADSSSSLFGEASVEVVLTGTSYSLRGNFHGFLQQALATQVLNTAKDGGGFLEAATEYLQDEAFRSSPPKVLIWEVPERFLGARLDAESDWLREVGL